MPRNLVIIALGVVLCMLGGCERQPSSSPQSDRHWLMDMAQAQQQAAKTNRPILANFTGSDWCIWCIKLESEVFSQKEFQKFAENNLVLLKVDFPQKRQQPQALKKQNKQLAEKYNIEGFPTILLLDKDGKVLATTGYQKGGAGNYIEHLKNLLKKS